MKMVKINREEYEILNQVEKPTKKQLNFIKVIEEEWKQNPFTGTTKKEATQYISQAVKEKERYDFENEAMGYGLPNQ